MEEVKKKDLTLEQAKMFADRAIADVKNGFIETGYYLKMIRDKKLWKEQKYKSFDVFLEENYAKDKSWASRCISLYGTFGKEELVWGEMPGLKQEYADYNVSQLIEMISLPEEKRELVTPETHVRAIRDMKPKREKKVATVATFEPEEKERELEEEKLSPIQRGCITGMNPYGACSCCGNEGAAECCGECEESCNVRCGWFEETREQQARPDQEEQEGKQGSDKFNTIPTSCPHRGEFSCTVLDENRSIPGDGYNCGFSCCWACKFQGMCKYECNASAGRDGEIPEYDAAWFVREWVKYLPEDLKRVLEACRRGSTNAERAKAVQEEISPYGAHNRSCWKYDFSFHGFAGGIDFRIGKVDIHLKYGRFVQELMNLYPDFEEPVGKGTENDIETPETVSKEPESVPDSPEIVIDGEFVELPPEPEISARSILEEEQKELQDWIHAFEADGVEAWPQFIKRQKIIIAALAAMVEELEKPGPEPEPEKQEQQELPLLKNNDQRAAFVDAYETWPLWIETRETGERYYRYDLPDGNSMVVKVYHALLFDYKAVGEKYEDRFTEGYGKHEYYFLREGKFFRDCETNRSGLVEKLKELQKKGKGE